jgi:iron complex transport system substrate-binding protein
MGFLDYIRRLGALVGAGDKANAYAESLQEGLAAIEREAARCRAGRRSISRNGTSR